MYAVLLSMSGDVLHGTAGRRAGEIDRVLISIYSSFNCIIVTTVLMILLLIIIIVIRLLRYDTSLKAVYKKACKETKNVVTKAKQEAANWKP